MHLVDTLRSLLRRWYIFLLGLLLSVGLGYAAFSVIQPTYEGESSLLLMPPTEVVGDHGNPYLYLGGMNEALDVLIRRANAPDAIAAIEEKFDGVKVSSDADRTTSAPIVVISVSGLAEDDVLKVLDAERSTVIRNLESMQNELDVPPNMRISTKDLVIASEAEANQKMAIQLAILVVAAGSVGTLMFTGFIDGQLILRAESKELSNTRRKRSKRRASNAGSNDTPDPHNKQESASELLLVDATSSPGSSGAGSR